jgi:hypothetical protein
VLYCPGKLIISHRVLSIVTGEGIFASIPVFLDGTLLFYVDLNHSTVLYCLERWKTHWYERTVGKRIVNFDR